MGEPSQIIKTHERVKVPESNNRLHSFVRVTIWVIVGVVVVGSILFQTNLLNEISWTAKMLLISMVIGISFWGPKSIPTPSDIEIWFYDDSFVVYRNKRYYSARVSHREFNKFYYDDVRGMDFDCRTQRFNIHGKIDATFFKYDKNGELPEKPYYHKITDGGICYFYVFDNDESDIISIMEARVGKKVTYRNKVEG